jgi:hypothetical protein
MNTNRAEALERNGPVGMKPPQSSWAANWVTPVVILLAPAPVGRYSVPLAHSGPNRESS